MATYTEKQIVDGDFISDSAAAIFTATAKTRVSAFSVTNTDTSAITISLYVVPDGATLGPEHLLAKDLVIGAGLTKIPHQILNQVIPAAGTIQAVASTADKAAVIASGFEIT